LHDNSRLIITSEFHVEQSHASKLAVLVDQILKATGCKPEDVDAIALSSGPGSYTGLRIGTSTAKGFCYSLNIPLISINTLELMVKQMMPNNFNNYLLCPMIDARRMEVYSLLSDAEGNVIESVEARIINEQSFQNFLMDRKIVFFGNGALKCKTVVTNDNAIFVEGIYPQASAMGALAFDAWNKKSFEDLSGYEPFYLKSFVAKKPKALN